MMKNDSIFLLLKRVINTDTCFMQIKKRTLLHKAIFLGSKFNIEIKGNLILLYNFIYNRYKLRKKQKKKSIPYICLLSDDK